MTVQPCLLPFEPRVVSVDVCVWLGVYGRLCMGVGG